MEELGKELHKKIFIQVIAGKSDYNTAKIEYEAIEKDIDSDGDYSDPVWDAEQCMQSWSE